MKTLFRIPGAVLLAAAGLVALSAPAAQAPDDGGPAPATGESRQGGPAAAGPSPVYRLHLRADYDPEEGRITAEGTLVWRNVSSQPVTELCFHHYLNAFANNRSTFMRGSGGQLRGQRFGGEGWGFVDVSSLTLADGTDLKAVERFAAPDDGNPDDRTVALYPLPQPVPPGGRIRLEMEFVSRLPEIFARTGAAGDYVLAGQWFPKIAVLEERDGQVAWSCHQFHANSEFFADFGDYDVTLTLPGRYRGRIGATGQLVEEKVADGRVTVRFVAEGVHDFAWTADPRFLVVTETFDPDRDVPAGWRREVARRLGLPDSELELAPVELTLLLQPAHRTQARRYLEAAKAALAGAGLYLGAYPYPTLTLVDPPLGAEGSGGMEYPTFITLGTAPLLSLPPFRQLRFPEEVTIHETLHQYWQGMVASDEFEESWLDEGITSYYEMLIMEKRYGLSVSFLGLDVSPLEVNRAALAGGRYRDPVVNASWKFRDRRSYGMNSYSRPAVTLRHLENLLGDEVFHRAMRRFFERFRWRHPETSDFEATIEEVAGRDLRWFFDQALHSTRTLDYAVATAESHPVQPFRGYSWLGGEPLLDPGDDEDDEAATAYRSTVVVERRGELVHPVTVELRFAGGSFQRRQWAGKSRWIRYRVTGPRLVSAEVDPDHLLALDVNRLNNGRSLDSRPLPRAKFAADFTFWLQTLMAAAGLAG